MVENPGVRGATDQARQVLIASDVTHFTEPGTSSNTWVDHMRGKEMSLGTYSISVGGVDDQKPHREDEIYVIVRGQASLILGLQRVDVAQGSAVYVPAGVEHRFVDVTHELTVLVVFFPPYTGR